MKKILIYSILLFALCSCDNFLEEDPRGKLTPSSFFSSPEDLDMAITGMYNKYYQTNARVFRAIYVWDRSEYNLVSFYFSRTFFDVVRDGSPQSLVAFKDKEPLSAFTSGNPGNNIYCLCPSVFR